MKAESQNVIQRLGLLSTEEAAQYLGVNLRNFYQNISKQIPTAGTFQVRNYYRRDDLDKWIASHFEVSASANIPQEVNQCS
jgi:hypothetical protein